MRIPLVVPGAERKERPSSLPSTTPWRGDLGSSMTRTPGWVCIDIDPTVRPHVVADFNRLPLPLKSGSISEVNSSQVAEHLHVHLIEFLQDIYRVLSPNGSLKMTVPNMFSIKNRLLFLFGRIADGAEWNPHHVKLISARYLFQLLRHIGFDPRFDYRRWPGLPYRHLVSGSLCVDARKRP